MIAKLLFFSLLPLAYGRQVAFVDLSKPVTKPGTPYPSHSEAVRGGGVLGHGTPKSPILPPIRLVINKIIPTRIGILVSYVAEVALTNEGDTPISVPIGVDEDLLLPPQQGRRALMFNAAFAKAGPGLQGGGISASDSEHPESSAVLERGDAVVFLVPLGLWPAEKVPSEEIIVSVQQERKVEDEGTDWTEMVGPKIRSENSLPLPPAPERTDGR